MNRYTLPPGIVKVCAGLVQGAKTEPYLSALCTAEQMIFDKYPAGQQDRNFGRTSGRCHQGERQAPAQTQRRNSAAAVRLEYQRKDFPPLQARILLHTSP